MTGSGAVRIEYDRQQLTAERLQAKVASLGLRQSNATPLPQGGAKEQMPSNERDHHAMPPEPSKAEDDAKKHDEDDHSGHVHSEGKSDHTGHEHAHGGLFGEQTELAFAAMAGVLLAAGWLIERASIGPAWLSTVFYIAAYGFGGFYTVKEAVENLRARRFEIDTLMLVAAVGAAALGKWAEGALLLFLFSLGHSFEHYAMGRARKAIEALAKLAPETAIVRRDDGSTEEIAVDRLQVADVVLVRPNERLPADGVVVVGSSSIDQAPVTGESMPVDKRPIADAKAALAAFDRVSAEHRVFAGTINGSGAIEVMVARLARTIDDGASGQDGHRGGGSAIADAAIHRTLRAHLCANCVGTGRATPLRGSRDRRAVLRQLLSRDGGACGCKPVRAGHLGAERRAQRRCAGRAGRRPGEGRWAVGEPRHADFHRFRQDRHAHRRQAQV